MSEALGPFPSTLKQVSKIETQIQGFIAVPGPLGCFRVSPSTQPVAVTHYCFGDNDKKQVYTHPANTRFPSQTFLVYGWLSLWMGNRGTEGVSCTCSSASKNSGPSLTGTGQQRPRWLQEPRIPWGGGG